LPRKQWLDSGKADLPAVGVAGKDQVDQRAARRGDDVLDVIGLMPHEEDGTGLGLPLRGNGEVEIGVAAEAIIQAGEPEALTCPLDGEILVDQDGGSVALEKAADLHWADDGVVVAENSEALRAGDAAKHFGAALGVGQAEADGERAAAAEVSSDENEVRRESVDAADDLVEEEVLGEFIQVDVADLDDAKAGKGRGQAANAEGPVRDVDLVAGDLIRVKREAGGGNGGTQQEVAAGEPAPALLRMRH
jgi:hypothetical protein